MKTPAIIIASYPKSGNTWLRYFLGAYLSGKSIAELASLEFAPLVERRDRFERITGRDFTEQAFFECRTEYLNGLRKVSPILKTHMPFLSYRGEAFFPVNSVYVCIWRSPYDLIPSFARHTGISIEDAMKAVMYVGATLEYQGAARKHAVNETYSIATWQGHLQSWLSARRKVVFVKYENLVAAPQQSFRRLIECLGLDFDPLRFEAARSETSLSNFQALEASGAFTEASSKAGAFFSKQSGRLARAELSAEDASHIDGVILAMNRKLLANPLAI